MSSGLQGGSNNKSEDLHQQIQAIITRLLQDSLESRSLEEHLQEALFLILAIPWMNMDAKGSIHIYEKKSDDLLLVAEQDLPESFHKNCRHLPIRESLCSQVIFNKEMRYYKDHDPKFDPMFLGMEDHGCYCIPIFSSDKLLGVLHLFIPGEYQENPKDSSFLRAITSTMAGIIVRCQQEIELQIANAALDRANHLIRKTFGSYLSKEIVDDILDTPDGMRLGGEEKTVTVLMTDLRGFTALCDQMPAGDVLNMLNLYLGVMTEILQVYNGTIIEILGDGILALFGAPVTREDDAQRAVTCALAMQNIMPAVNARNRIEGYPTLEMGAGINTGMVIAGNIGSNVRRKYGVVGQTINMAARLESLSVGSQVLISENTVKACNEELLIEKQWQEKFKGVHHPVTVSHIVGIGGPDGGVKLSRPKKIAMRPVETKLTVGLAAIVGKSISNEKFSGSITAIGLPCIEIATSLQLSHHENVNINLFDANNDML
ncbi:MAG: GAF domain-containing protein, partial [Magnetococcales bacterium]|nr:GAF domain-containing protein [Magnetococcales bacterium]